MNADHARDLRRPFSVDAVKFKPQTANLETGKGLVTFHIDARLAAERLNTVVGGENWSDEYRILFEQNPQAHMGFYFPIECRLTVAGLTKTDVGNYQKNGADAMALKSGYSDAFKRAAVKFGVGASLYATPKIYAELDTYEDRSGKKRASGFSKAGIQRIKTQYAQWLKSDLCLPHFGEPLEHALIDDTELEEAPAETGLPVPSSPPAAQEAQAGSAPTITQNQAAQLRRLFANIRTLDPENEKLAVWDKANEDLSYLRWSEQGAREWINGAARLIGELETKAPKEEVPF